jgi:hypothetical protein
MIELPKKAQPFVEQIGATTQQFEELGLPTGDDKESIKQRLLVGLEKMGVMELFPTPAEKQQFAIDLDALAQAVANKDTDAIQKNPIVIKMQDLVPQQGQPQQAQPQKAATKDFASMMPPAGGGVGGR